MLQHTTDLDLRLIRVFLAIVDAGGLSAAQATLEVGQSTLSAQLATLETRLGFRLCERGRGGFRLTPKGERFEPLARQLCATLADFSAQARDMDRRLVGSLAIGLIGHAPMAQNLRLGRAIARFRQRDEAVRLTLRVGAPAELEEQLLSGQIQLAIGYFWHRVPSLVYTPVCIERQIACCGASHALAPLAAAGTLVDAQALAEASWAWRSYPVAEARGALPARGASGAAAVADNMEAMAVLILSGRHLGYLPEHAARPYIEAGLMHALNPGTLHYDVSLHLVSRRRGAQDEITRAFLDDLRAVHLEPQTRAGHF